MAKFKSHLANDILVTLIAVIFAFVPVPVAAKSIGAASVGAVPVVAASTGLDPVAAGESGIEFFESRIRPVLAEHCYSCHSVKSKNLKGELRLDSSEALRKGGENGEVIVSGDPQKSSLIAALRYEGLRMPPKGKLPDRVIADFESWVKMGAPFPAGAKVSSAVDSKSAMIAANGNNRNNNGKTHWAFQPVPKPVVPAVKDKSLAPIDRFVASRLMKAGIAPSPRADRRTLIRRAYYDLIGLPPTVDDVEKFVADGSPNAFAQLVDRLLESPQYGERWGRHWLDVARYADTKDLVLLFGDARLRPYAYTYRDYVVKALNADTPYNRFLEEQLAADQLNLNGENWRLAAMGFLTLGRMFDGNLPDVLDDQVDTTTRGMLGLTVSCARCHDHKYDPIPTADYYSLYGVFANSELPIDLPRVDEVSKASAPTAQFEATLLQKRKELQKFIDAQYDYIRKTARDRTADYLVKIATEKPDPMENAVFFLSLGPNDLKPQIVLRWRQYLAKYGKAEDPVLGAWHDLIALSDTDFAPQALKTIERFLAKKPGTAANQLNPLVATMLRSALQNSKMKSKGDVARNYAAMFVELATTISKTRWVVTPEQQQLMLPIFGPEAPVSFSRHATYLYMARVDRETYGKKLQELDTLAVASPNAAPRAMILVDSPQIMPSRIFKRGNPNLMGDPVQRQFPQIVAGSHRKPFQNGSGRLELAKAITAPDNPLTARVFVNRVWMHHFGEPLVSTPGDFGTRSSPPTHPELLDYLASRFVRPISGSADPAREMEEGFGWSLKRLHKEIMLSKTYQQASADRPDGKAKDPENHLLWRARRQRLDWESLRDTLLSVSGRLDPTMGGRPTNVAGDALNRRRTIYGLVDRQDLPASFRSFDFAVPDQTVDRRPMTTVPQQALFVMNSPFMVEQAKALAAQLPKTEIDAAKKVRTLYRKALGRDATKQEAELAIEFVKTAESAAKAKLNGWEQFAQVLLSTNELMFVD